MVTDLERLHDTIKSWPNHRRQGRTFAACHNLAGLFETLPPGSTVAWLLPKYDWTRHIIPMLDEVFTEHGLCVAWDSRRMRLYCKDTAVWCVFVVRPKDLRGREIRAVVDDLDEYRDNVPPRTARRMGEAVKCYLRPLETE